MPELRRQTNFGSPTAVYPYSSRRVPKTVSNVRAVYKIDRGRGTFIESEISDNG